MLYVDEDLIKYAWPQDVWFHVDKLSSAHVYLRMPESMTWDKIPEALLADCAQLVKANSIEGSSIGAFPQVLRYTDRDTDTNRKQERQPHNNIYPSGQSEGVHHSGYETKKSLS
jgi:hypothetical protein